MEIPERLKSRKLWVFVLTFILAVVNAAMGSPVPQEAAWPIVILAAGYFLGQGVADLGKMEQLRDAGTKLGEWVKTELVDTGVLAGLVKRIQDGAAEIEDGLKGDSPPKPEKPEPRIIAEGATKPSDPTELP